MWFLGAVYLGVFGTGLVIGMKIGTIYNFLHPKES